MSTDSSASSFNIIHIVHQSATCVDLVVASRNTPIILDPNAGLQPFIQVALDRAQLDNRPITIRLTCLDQEPTTFKSYPTASTSKVSPSAPQGLEVPTTRFSSPPADSVTEPSTPIHLWAHCRSPDPKSPSGSVTEPESDENHPDCSKALRSHSRVETKARIEEWRSLSSSSEGTGGDEGRLSVDTPKGGGGPVHSKRRKFCNDHEGRAKCTDITNSPSKKPRC
ncbi:hypothetical protein AAF712_012451 [Marasmius tenuissimus]|uniref:Uncharacterized protein n=1 Tax=Marasmius tenuissimus TaxID=585030 RepID=A0ABR2ZHD6_9AGAR